MLCIYVINSYVLEAINYFFYYLLRSKEEQAAVRKKDSVGARVFSSGPHLVFMISQFYEDLQSFFLPTLRCPSLPLTLATIPLEGRGRQKP